MRRGVSTAVFLLAVSWGAAPASADCFDDCDYWLNVCRQSCSQCACEADWESCRSFCQYTDSDGDGVVDPSDNCSDHANANQADCDNDGLGNVCDPENARYVRVSSQRCLIDKDVHVPPNYYYDLEDWFDGIYVDQSSCGAPQKIQRYKNNEAHCYNVSPKSCCLSLIVNDSWWCTHIDQSYCQG